MPNWCNGEVIVKGKPKDIENFCKLFLFEEDINKKNSKGKNKYFARSFVYHNWEDFKEELLGGSVVEFGVDFAWSCWSCLFEGYPNGKKCVTLEWAIKKYNVEVEIKTEEGGMGFEEKITTKDGKPIYESFDMPKYECQNCGNKQSIPSSYDLDEEECYECGRVGVWKDDLQELIKEKIERDKVKDEKNKTKSR